MASSMEYLEYVLDCLRECSGVTHRKMMGEYLLYYNGKVFGGVYDDRFLVKIVPASQRMLSDALPELPYEGGSPMLPVAEENPLFLKELVEAMYDELPAPKQRKKK